MFFVISTTDKPGSDTLRADKRQAHRDYLEALNKAGSIVLSGPFISAQGTPDGSMIMVDVEDLAAAKSIAENDPYSQCGLFEEVQTRQWVWGMNAPPQKEP
jgi:hypothetical protein